MHQNKTVSHQLVVSHVVHHIQRLQSTISLITRETIAAGVETEMFFF